MGSYGSLGSAEPYVQAGSESAVQAAIGGSIMKEFIIIMEI